MPISPHRAHTAQAYQRELRRACTDGRVATCPVCGRVFRNHRSPHNPHGLRYCSTTCANRREHL